ADGSANSTPASGVRGETAGGVTGNGNGVDETAVYGGVIIASTGADLAEGNNALSQGERLPYDDFAPPRSGSGGGIGGSGVTPAGSTLGRADLNPEEVEWGKSTGFSGT
ncbi:unnamed protein product, partial [Laminaria digitata]